MSSNNNSTASRSPTLAAANTKANESDAANKAQSSSDMLDQTASVEQDADSGVAQDISHKTISSSETGIDQASDPITGNQASENAVKDSANSADLHNAAGETTSLDAANDFPLDPAEQTSQPKVHKTKAKKTKRKKQGRKAAATAQNSTVANDTDNAIGQSWDTMQAVADGNGAAAASSKKPQTKKRSTLDEELDKKLQAELKKPAKWGTQVEPIKAADMRDDFKLMGFSSDKIEEMMSTKEPIKVDGATQRPAGGGGMCVANTGPEPTKRRRKPAARGQAKYEPLSIYEEQNWVLFDPLKGFPAFLGGPSTAISRWAQFQPGNQRVLLFNTLTQSVRTQTVPDVLRGKAVNYTDLGPKITGFKPVKSTKKKSAPDATAAEIQEAPALGRGARRNTRELPSSEATNSSPAAGKKRKADAVSSSEPLTSTPASKEATELHPVAGNKRKSEEMASPEENIPSSPPKAPRTLLLRALKGKRTFLPGNYDVISAETAKMPRKRRADRASTVAQVAETEPKERKKRRPGRPKITPTMVENSSSDGKEVVE